MRKAKSAAATAIWMKRPIFFNSFLAIQFSGLKSGTAEAIRQWNLEGWNCVMGPTPLAPAMSFFHTASVPIPRAQTSPTPVTTTRRLNYDSPCKYSGEGGLLLSLGVLVDVCDRIFHCGDFLGVLVGNFDSKSFLKSHHQFDRIERIGAQIVYERGCRRDFRLVHAQLLYDDLLDAFFYTGHSVCLRCPPRRSALFLFVALERPPILFGALNQVNRCALSSCACRHSRPGHAR